MRKTMLWILVVLLSISVVGTIYYILSTSKKTPEGAPDSVVLPSSQTGTGQMIRISVTTQAGEHLPVQDFVHNGITIADPANEEIYYLAGSSGACKADGTCPVAGNQKEFTILYYQNEQVFGIGLLTEPLGAVRAKAERQLMQTLGLSTDQMCALNYSVMTTSYVSKVYGGQELGFSFCPGAVKLP